MKTVGIITIAKEISAGGKTWFPESFSIAVPMILSWSRVDGGNRK
tara:strand:- start:88 stop:222 length:135 start_codon:yes stop_codon:yes gene_type:complete